jgi:hypothetical protein
MTIVRSVADVLRDHVTLELEGIDRMYLNVYVPLLQSRRRDRLVLARASQAAICLDCGGCPDDRGLRPRH